MGNIIWVLILTSVISSTSANPIGATTTATPSGTGSGEPWTDSSTPWTSGSGSSDDEGGRDCYWHPPPCCECRYNAWPTWHPMRGANNDSMSNNGMNSSSSDHGHWHGAHTKRHQNLCWNLHSWHNRHGHGEMHGNMERTMFGGFHGEWLDDLNKTEWIGREIVTKMFTDDDMRHDGWGMGDKGDMNGMSDMGGIVDMHGWHGGCGCGCRCGCGHMHEGMENGMGGMNGTGDMGGMNGTGGMGCINGTGGMNGTGGVGGMNGTGGMGGMNGTGGMNGSGDMHWMENMHHRHGGCGCGCCQCCWGCPMHGGMGGSGMGGMSGSGDMSGSGGMSGSGDMNWMDDMHPRHDGCGCCWGCPMHGRMGGGMGGEMGGGMGGEMGGLPGCNMTHFNASLHNGTIANSTFADCCNITCMKEGNSSRGLCCNGTCFKQAVTNNTITDIPGCNITKLREAIKNHRMNQTGQINQPYDGMGGMQDMCGMNRVHSLGSFLRKMKGIPGCDMDCFNTSLHNGTINNIPCCNMSCLKNKTDHGPCCNATCFKEAVSNKTITSLGTCCNMTIMNVTLVHHSQDMHKGFEHGWHQKRKVNIMRKMFGGFDKNDWLANKNQTQRMWQHVAHKMFLGPHMYSKLNDMGWGMEWSMDDMGWGMGDMELGMGDHGMSMCGWKEHGIGWGYGEATHWNHCDDDDDMMCWCDIICDSSECKHTCKQDHISRCAAAFSNCTNRCANMTSSSKISACQETCLQEAKSYGNMTTPHIPGCNLTCIKDEIKRSVVQNVSCCDIQCLEYTPGNISCCNHTCVVATITNGSINIFPTCCDMNKFNESLMKCAMDEKTQPKWPMWPHKGMGGCGCRYHGHGSMGGHMGCGMGGGMGGQQNNGLPGCNMTHFNGSLHNSTIVNATLGGCCNITCITDRNSTGPCCNATCFKQAILNNTITNIPGCNITQLRYIIEKHAMYKTVQNATDGCMEGMSALRIPPWASFLGKMKGIPGCDMDCFNTSLHNGTINNIPCCNMSCLKNKTDYGPCCNVTCFKEAVFNKTITSLGTCCNMTIMNVTFVHNFPREMNKTGGHGMPWVGHGGHGMPWGGHGIPCGGYGGHSMPWVKHGGHGMPCGGHGGHGMPWGEHGGHGMPCGGHSMPWGEHGGHGMPCGGHSCWRYGCCCCQSYWHCKGGKNVDDGTTKPPKPTITPRPTSPPRPKSLTCTCDTKKQKNTCIYSEVTSPITIAPKDIEITKTRKGRQTNYKVVFNKKNINLPNMVIDNNPIASISQPKKNKYKYEVVVKSGSNSICGEVKGKCQMIQTPVKRNKINKCKIDLTFNKNKNSFSVIDKCIVKCKKNNNKVKCFDKKKNIYYKAKKVKYQKVNKKRIVDILT